MATGGFELQTVANLTQLQREQFNSPCDRCRESKHCLGRVSGEAKTKTPVLDWMEFQRLLGIAKVTLQWCACQNNLHFSLRMDFQFCYSISCYEWKCPGYLPLLSFTPGRVPSSFLVNELLDYILVVSIPPKRHSHWEFKFGLGASRNRELTALRGHLLSFQ